MVFSWITLLLKTAALLFIPISSLILFDVFDSFHGQEEQDSFETNCKEINTFTGQVDNYLKNLKTVSESGIMVEASAIKSLKLLADKNVSVENLASVAKVRVAPLVRLKSWE